jgi:hypothetical protein
MAATKDTVNSPVDRLRRKLLGNKSRPIVWFLIAISTTELTLVSNEAVGQVAQKADHGLTCNLDGIPSQERARYTDLFESLRHAIRDKHELPGGFALLLDPAQFTMDQALEWSKLERECCPFLETELRWDIRTGLCGLN